MTVSLAFGSSLAALILIGSALADQPEAPGVGGKSASERQSHDAQAAVVIARVATVTQEIEQLITIAAVVLPEAPETAAVGNGATPIAVSLPEATPAGESGTPLAAPLPGIAASPNRIAKKKLADKSEKQRHDRPAAEAKPLCVRPVGKAETGTAAWYGGKYVGRRTTSGVRLDTTHATAAHRTLPLNSLARVTNLHNGRSVIVRVTDRGPLAESLLIDMSPRAAEELRMKRAGLAPVMVEQVVEVPPDPK